MPVETVAAYCGTFAWCCAASLARGLHVGDRALLSPWSLAACVGCGCCGLLSLGAAPGLAGAIGIAATAVAAWSDVVASKIYHAASISGAALVLAARIAAGSPVWSALLTACVLAAFFLGWRRWQGTGGGDVGLAFVAGLAFGPFVVQEAFVVGGTIALAVLGALIAARRISRRTFVPMAPFLLTGIVVLAQLPPAWRAA